MLYEVITKFSDVYKVGVVAEIKQIIKTPDNITRVLVEGVYKAKLISLFEEGEAQVKAEIKKIPNTLKYDEDDNQLKALVRTVKDAFEQYAFSMPRMPKELVSSVFGENNPDKVFESIVFNITLVNEEKQQLLEMTSIYDKLSLLFSLLTNEAEVLAIEREIHEQVNENIDRNQREYFLREQLKVIQSQLGDSDDNNNGEIFRYFDKIGLV